MYGEYRQLYLPSWNLYYRSYLKILSKKEISLLYNMLVIDKCYGKKKQEKIEYGKERLKMLAVSIHICVVK